jgi:hypothetical protein
VEQAFVLFDVLGEGVEELADAVVDVGGGSRATPPMRM